MKFYYFESRLVNITREWEREGQLNRNDKSDFLAVEYKATWLLFNGHRLNVCRRWLDSTWGKPRMLTCLCERLPCGPVCRLLARARATNWIRCDLMWRLIGRHCYLCSRDFAVFCFVIYLLLALLFVLSFGTNCLDVIVRLENLTRCNNSI